SLLSFKTGQPSAFTIETLAPCEIWAFHKKHWEDLIEKAPVIKQLFQDILEELFIAKLQREMQMLKYSPEELYLFLINSNPIIFKEAPLKYIATYLGITPQSLCRLRNRIARRRS
ncbi:Crp/Fnr family transcriptional regulator, partial [Bacteroides pyogenes]